MHTRSTRETTTAKGDPSEVLFNIALWSLDVNMIPQGMKAF